GGSAKITGRHSTGRRTSAGQERHSPQETGSQHLAAYCAGGGQEPRNPPNAGSRGAQGSAPQAHRHWNGPAGPPGRGQEQAADASRTECSGQGSHEEREGRSVAGENCLANESINWHRLFGLILLDFFTDSPFVVELEKDLSIK